jgi:hypothetical protein
MRVIRRTRNDDAFPILRYPTDDALTREHVHIERGTSLTVG